MLRMCTHICIYPSLSLSLQIYIYIYVYILIYIVIYPYTQASGNAPGFLQSGKAQRAVRSGHFFGQRRRPQTAARDRSGPRRVGECPVTRSAQRQAWASGFSS